MRPHAGPAGRRSAAGEQVLAWADAGRDLAGRHPRRALRRPRRRRGVPWEQVEAADWDRDDRAAPGQRGRAVGRAAAGAHARASSEPGPLLAAGPRAGDRQRRAAAPRAGRRRARPTRDRPARAARRRPIAWVYEYDEGVDPDDPEVRRGGRARRWPRPATSVGLLSRPRRGASRFAAAAALLICAGCKRSPVAQLAEHSAVNRRVVGSSPTGGAKKAPDLQRRRSGAVSFISCSVSRVTTQAAGVPDVSMHSRGCRIAAMGRAWVRHLRRLTEACPEKR